MATHARLIASVSWANGMNYQSDLLGGIIWDLWRPCFFNELENNIFFLRKLLTYTAAHSANI